MGQKGLFKQNGHFGGILVIKAPQGREPDSKNGLTVNFQVLGPVNLNAAS